MTAYPDATSTEEWRTAHAVDPEDLRSGWERRRARGLLDRPPFTTKASIVRGLRAGDRIELVHHRIPERSRIATVVKVTRHELALSGTAGSADPSYVQWPPARCVRIVSGWTFSLLELPTGDAAEGPAWITFRLIG